jgi:hypothetical protein
MKLQHSKLTTLTLSAFLGALALACSDGSGSAEGEKQDADKSTDDAGDPDDGGVKSEEEKDMDMDTEAMGGMGGGMNDQVEVPAVPEILSSWPADGDAGFLFNDSFVIEFSVPMDKESVEASYVSKDLPAGAVEFSWNEDGTKLTITPDEKLDYNIGVVPEDIENVFYYFGISTNAKSVDGESLTEGHDVTFATARRMVEYLEPVSALSGGVRTEGYVTDDIVAGDSGKTDDEDEVTDWWYIGMISFDLDELPGEVVLVNWAQLGASQAVINGTPFADLGGQVYLYDVSFTERDFDALLPQLSSPILMLSDSGADESILVNVGDQVVADFEAGRSLSQFALTFANETDDEGLADSTKYSEVDLKVNYFIK